MTQLAPENDGLKWQDDEHAMLGELRVSIDRFAGAVEIDLPYPAVVTVSGGEINRDVAAHVVRQWLADKLLEMCEQAEIEKGVAS